MKGGPPLPPDASSPALNAREAHDEGGVDPTSRGGDLRGRSVRAGTVMLLAQGAKLGIMLGSTAVLARLLTPADFGLLAMVMAVTNFVGRLRDLGLSTATVQSASITQPQLNTLFWVNLAFGGVLTLAMIAAAPLTAWAYGEPRLTWIAMALAATFLLSGAAAQHQALLRRQMRFGRLAIVETVALLIGVVGAVVAALAGAGFWALVVLQLVSGAALTVGLWTAGGWRPGRPARGTGIRPFLSFGGFLVAAQLLDAAKFSVQQFLLGRFCGASALGLFSRGQYLLQMPLVHLQQPVANVAVSTLSRLQHDTARFRSFYRWGLQIMAMLGMPIAVFLFVAAEPAVLVVLGRQWEDAIPLVRALAPGAFVLSFNMATGWLYVSQGQSARQFRWMALSSIAFIAAVSIGLRWGVLGVAIATSLALCVLRIPGILYCLRTMPVTGRDLLDVLWRPAVASCAAGVVALSVDVLIESDRGLAALLVDGLAFGLAYMGAWLLLPGGQRVLRELWTLIPLLRGGRPGIEAASE